MLSDGDHGIGPVVNDGAGGSTSPNGRCPAIVVSPSAGAIIFYWGYWFAEMAKQQDGRLYQSRRSIACHGIDSRLGKADRIDGGT